MGKATRISGMIYNTDEKAWKYRTAEWCVSLTLLGKYIGYIFKGWWRLGPWADMEKVEIQFSVGGEDNMVQFGGALPFLAGSNVSGLAGSRLRTKDKGTALLIRPISLLAGYVQHIATFPFGHQPELVA